MLYGIWSFLIEFVADYFFEGWLVLANTVERGMKMNKLSEVKEGQKATITMIQGDARFLNRITSIGLTLGCNVEILRNEKRLPILLYSRDSMVALNRDESGGILVEVHA